MSTNKHAALIESWFSNTPPTHFFHNGAGTGWYVFKRESDGQYLIMMEDDNVKLKAVGIADEYSEVTDLYNIVKVGNPNARWIH